MTRCLIGLYGLECAMMLWNVPLHRQGRVVSLAVFGFAAAAGVGAVWRSSRRVLVGRLLHAMLIVGLFGITLLLFGNESWLTLTLVSLGGGAGSALSLTWTAEWKVQSDRRAALSFVPVLAAVLIAFYVVDRRWGSEYSVGTWLGLLAAALALVAVEPKSRSGAQP